jgi:hypothetical protein
VVTSSQQQKPVSIRLGLFATTAFLLCGSAADQQLTAGQCAGNAPRPTVVSGVQGHKFGGISGAGNGTLLKRSWVEALKPSAAVKSLAQ